MIVGIDLGTTHSLVGRYGAHGPELFPNALGALLTPSVVSLDDDGNVLVGAAARDRLITHPQSSIATFKRWMGTARETRLGKHQFRPEDLSALILKSLIADAEAATGEKVTEAVISVPAYFGDAQRKATRIAGELAGIKVERLINEPTAAALAYGLQERVDGATFIVLDLGGGTFDVSILEIFDGVMQVHASAGDNRLGGEDFLEALVSLFAAEMKLDLRTISRPEMARLHAKIDQVKRALSTQDRVDVEVTLQGETYHWEITENRFQLESEPLLQRIRAPIERAIRDAKLTPADLSEVVLVGGASRMPIFTRLIARMLGRLPLRHVNPDEAIALGACVAAGMKARNQALEETVMTDVCPYTLGVGVSRDHGNGRRTEGHFSPILERNSTVPVSRSSTFNAVEDNQREIVLEVYQGESPRVANNVLLGALSVKLPPRTKVADSVVDVRFTYDVNGVLQVEAKLLATGKVEELILQNNPGVLDEQEVRERLKALEDIKVHPRDVQANKATIAKLERVYEERLDLRPMLDEWLSTFMAHLETQDTQAIERIRSELDGALAEIDSSPFA